MLGNVNQGVRSRRRRFHSVRRRLVRRLTALVAVGAVGVLGLPSCAGSELNIDGRRQVCSGVDSRYCNEVTDHAGAYTPVHGRLFCEVEQLREQIEGGEIGSAEATGRLRDWVDDSSQDGVPVILDVRGVPVEVAPERDDAIARVTRDGGGAQGRDDYWRCVQSMSQEMLEQELGGPLRADE